MVDRSTHLGFGLVCNISLTKADTKGACGIGSLKLCELLCCNFFRRFQGTLRVGEGLPHLERENRGPFWSCGISALGHVIG